MTDTYLYAIAALLPVTAVMLLLQTNPYNALILRGVLGAIAALVYAIFGAGDVALTEALMGTLLAISLYAIAVRSSMVVKLGILTDNPHSDILIDKLRHIFNQRYLRLELITYPDLPTLQQALIDRQIHITLAPDPTIATDNPDIPQPERLVTRIHRLEEIVRSELDAAIPLVYFNPESSSLTVTEQPQ